MIERRGPRLNRRTGRGQVRYLWIPSESTTSEISKKSENEFEALSHKLYRNSSILRTWIKFGTKIDRWLNGLWGRFYPSEFRRDVMNDRPLPRRTEFWLVDQQIHDAIRIWAGQFDHSAPVGHVIQQISVYNGLPVWWRRLASQLHRAVYDLERINPSNRNSAMNPQFRTSFSQRFVRHFPTFVRHIPPVL